MKKLIILGMLLLAGLSAWADDALYLKVRPGESIKAFNKSGISSVRLKAQTLQKAASSMGVEHLHTKVQSQFFPLNDKHWKSGLAEYQNNILRKIIFSNDKIEGTHAGELFSELEKTFGPDFSIYPFKSFDNEGLTFQWIDNKKFYEFSVSQNKHQQWSYVLEVKAENDKNLNRAKLDIAAPEVVAVLYPLMDKPFKKTASASAR